MLCNEAVFTDKRNKIKKAHKSLEHHHLCRNNNGPCALCMDYFMFYYFVSQTRKLTKIPFNYVNHESTDNVFAIDIRYVGNYIYHEVSHCGQIFS
jgi:hypothetical protein